jgi:predicted lipoprotein with Yx(FWY)xxD motif
MTQRRVALVGVAATLGVGLTACGGSPGMLGSGGHGAAMGDAPATDGVQNPGGSGAAASVRANVSTWLGTIVVDDGGRTLYRFDRDRARPSTSTCADACARAWPPVRWAAAPRVTGVDAGRVGRVRRPDGTWQLTIGGWPMYRYAKDIGPGDVSGQGLGGTWFATTPTGARATGARPPGTDEPGRAPDAPGGGYDTPAT